MKLTNHIEGEFEYNEITFTKTGSGTFEVSFYMSNKLLLTKEFHLEDAEVFHLTNLVGKIKITLD